MIGTENVNYFFLTDVVSPIGSSTEVYRERPNCGPVIERARPAPNTKCLNKFCLTGD